MAKSIGREALAINTAEVVGPGDLVGRVWIKGKFGRRRDGLVSDDSGDIGPSAQLP